MITIPKDYERSLGKLEVIDLRKPADNSTVIVTPPLLSM